MATATLPTGIKASDLVGPYNDNFTNLIHNIGWAKANAMGITKDSLNSGLTSQGIPTNVPVSAYDPSGTNTMGGGLGTSNTAAGTDFNKQNADTAAAANNWDIGNNISSVTIPDARTDAAYQRQVSALALALSQYQNQINLQNQQYNTNFNNRLEDMGWLGNADPNTKGMLMAGANGGWNTAKGSGSFAEDFGANQGDFAGRGAFRSGVYQQAVADLQNNYNQQKGRMDTAKQQYLDTNNSALQMYTQQNQAAQQAALGDAVARIALQYGINPSAVPGQ